MTQSGHQDAFRRLAVQLSKTQLPIPVDYGEKLCRTLLFGSPMALPYLQQLLLR